MRCVESLSSSLSKAGATVESLTPESKTAKVSYDPAKTTVHQLAQAVAETQPVHEQRYEAGLLVAVEDLPKNLAKLQAALRRVKGVANATPVPNSPRGEMQITFAALPRQAKAADSVKASQIAEVLQKSGVRFSGLDLSSPIDSPAKEPDSKAKPTTAKGTAKTKSSSNDMHIEKAKPSRSPSTGANSKSPTSGTKTKPAREVAPPSKSRETAPEDTPRFQILVAGDKVYLVDHEAKLKKFVKAGDQFGDFQVKEIADQDGWFVVLENPKTGEIIRVEERKEKDKEKTKEGKAKESKDTDAGHKKESNDTDPGDKKESNDTDAGDKNSE